MTTFDLDLRPTPTAAIALPVASSASMDWLRLVAATLARVVLFSVLGLALWGALPTAIAWQPTTVMTGSMEPRIQPGDVVVAKPVAADDLSLGQVLLFDDPDHADHLRLHRYEAAGDSGTLVTKGDANPQADSTPVEPAAVHGVAALRVPWVGLPVLWLQEGRTGALVLTAAGLLLLVGVSRLDAGLRARQESRDEAATDLAPVRHRGERRAARRRERRLRRLRTAGASLALVGLAGGVAVTLVVAGGSSAAYSAPTANPTSTLASSDAYDCLAEKFQGTPSIAYSYSESSGTTALDSSGGGRNGTLSAGVSRVGGSCATNGSPYVVANGTTGQITTPTSLQAPNTFTAQTWFRTTTTRGGVLFSFGNTQTSTPGQYDRHVYMTNAGKLVLGAYPGAVKTVTSPLSYNDNAWHLATATMSSAGMVLYVDGRAVASDASVTSGEPFTGWWRVGSGNTGNWPTPPSSNFFAGSLDESAFHNGQALTAAQVQAAFAAGR